MLATLDFPRPREYRGEELSFIGTFTDLPPLRPPRVRLLHLDLSTIPEEESEKQNDNTSTVSGEKNTDMKHSIIGNSRDFPHSDADAEEPSEAEVLETAHHPTRSEEDLLLIEAGYGPSVNCVQSTPTTSLASSTSESARAEPQSESSTESSPRHTGDLVKEVASKRVPKYSMLAVRGRHRASVALAADMLIDEEANIVRPEDFVCAEDYGMGYRDE
ncbi:hypothetical protein FOMPIDRAFT_82006 [Fomitopsis schrenkii]|uniref:Uncharacterized protein n=1 Tax=Fomitopsis schrenkii TaxID=2126942 RepID=S8ENZ1_FOMSC|nr:hypothetical protein FOMPIDRAFT_82006 [Fomitopsis schrenkii]